MPQTGRKTPLDARRVRRPGLWRRGARRCCDERQVQREHVVFDAPGACEADGDAAGKLKAAALAKVPGSTVICVQEGGHNGAAYHAHVKKSDGTEVELLIDKEFKVTAVNEIGRRP